MVHIKNALVVILGIGDYDGNMANLIGIPKDYKNLIATFYKVFGYSVLFLDENNELHYCNKKPNHNYDITKQTKLKSDKFKIKWGSEEIDDFVDKSRQILTNTNDKGQLIHDSLLFFISCHGDMDNVILDSDCEPVSLPSMFNQFCGEKCPQMLDKPKVFFGDTCRGSMKSRIKINSETASPENGPISNLEIDVDLYENLDEIDNKAVKMTDIVDVKVDNILTKENRNLNLNEKALGKDDHVTFRGQHINRHGASKLYSKTNDVIKSIISQRSKL